jgi:isoleucyl-tRNA synthetase
VKLPEEYRDIVADELNVKEVNWVESPPDLEINVSENVRVTAEVNVSLNPELKREGQMREIVRHVQKARKDAGLDVDNRINLELVAEAEELGAVLNDQILTDTIKQETLTTNFGGPIKDSYETTVKIDGAELTIKLSKVLDSQEP